MSSSWLPPERATATPWTPCCAGTTTVSTPSAGAWPATTPTPPTPPRKRSAPSSTPSASSATPPPDGESRPARVGGESAPDVAGHVEGCQQCAARVDTLRRVAAAVGRAPAPASAAGREAALAAALAEAGQQPDAPVVEIHDDARRRRTPRPIPGWLAAAVDLDPRIAV